MYDLKAQILLERLEVTIAVEQGMALDQTEGGNQAIDRLSDRTPVRPQQTVVPCRRQSQLLASGDEDLEVQELGRVRVKSESR